MKANLRALILTTALALFPLTSAFAGKAGAAGVIELPLPYHGDEVRKPINSRLLLVASPASDEGLDIEAVEAHAGPDSLNLLYHSKEWHGPYPTQVYAWQVAERYFPNSRWVCVRGYPIEVHIIIEHPTVKKVGEKTVFEGGRLVVAWFNRPCTRGFWNKSDAPNAASR